MWWPVVVGHVPGSSRHACPLTAFVTAVPDTTVTKHRNTLWIPRVPSETVFLVVGDENSRRESETKSGGNTQLGRERA